MCKNKMVVTHVIYVGQSVASERFVSILGMLTDNTPNLTQMWQIKGSPQWMMVYSRSV
jgi:hypothetical protein